MTPDEITATYQVLAEEAPAYANALVDRAGMAQASLGTMADRVRGGSQTANVGNYTYNRLVRPTVDTMRDQLVVEGLSQGLQAQMSQALKNAKQNYQNAYNAYSSRSSGGGGGGNNSPETPNDTYGGITVEETAEEAIPDAPTTSNLVQGGYKFDNYSNLLGQTGKYPTSVVAPTPQQSVDMNSWWAQQGGNKQDQVGRNQAWVDYLYSIGYGG